MTYFSLYSVISKDKQTKTERERERQKGEKRGRETDKRKTESAYKIYKIPTPQLLQAIISRTPHRHTFNDNFDKPLKHTLWFGLKSISTTGNRVEISCRRTWN